MWRYRSVVGFEANAKLRVCSQIEVSLFDYLASEFAPRAGAVIRPALILVFYSPALAIESFLRTQLQLLIWFAKLDM